jgi:16S rRNA (cytosine967-C5)-methyltransferase
MISVSNNFLFTIALDCIQGYNFLEPFALYLKKYFQANPKLGSRDRRNIRQLCYAWWRLGNAVNELPINERMAVALFLSYNQIDAFSERIFKDEKLLSSIVLHPKLKRDFLQQYHAIILNTSEIFPFCDLVESDFSLDDFVFDGFLRRNLWVRIKKNFEMQALAFFENNKVDFKIHHSSNLSIQLPDDFDVINSVPYLKGWIEIQDLSSQLLGAAYSPQSNEKWLDACAASGGKSLQLLDMQPNVDLTVTDIRESILINLQLRFKRNYIKHYKSSVVDWSNSTSDSLQSELGLFDAIIADVPCSGSGTWARTPEQKLSFTKEKLQHFSELQFAITSNLLAVLKKGGALYYSTCSVYKNENVDVVNRLVENNSLDLVEQKVISGIGSYADTMYFAKLIKK